MAKPKPEVANEITLKLQEAAAYLHKIYVPQWDARADVLKTIVSLSSASIVLSVTFSSSLRDLKLNAPWRYLVLFSFALLVASLILAVIALWVGTKVYEVQSSTFDTRQEIQKAFMDSATYDDFMTVFTKIQTRINTRIAESDQLATKLFHFSLALFCLAILALATVGAKQVIS